MKLLKPLGCMVAVLLLTQCSGDPAPGTETDPSLTDKPPGQTRVDESTGFKAQRYEGVITGTFMDPNTSEVIMVKDAGEKEVVFWYSNGKKAFQSLKVVDSGLEKSEPPVPFYQVKFEKDEKLYMLRFEEGMYGIGIECSNPDQTQQEFDFVIGTTNMAFRPDHIFREMLNGTFVDTHTGEMLLFSPKEEDKFEIWYSNGKKPFRQLKLVSIDEKQIKISFESGDVYTLETVPGPMGRLRTKGRDGVQEFFGLFSENDPAKADPAQMAQDALEGGFAKPVTYFYPLQETNIKVKLNTVAGMKVSYPAYPISGWQLTAFPDGSLLNKENGKQYPSLFWETESDPQPWDLSEGFLVKGEETAEFLEDKLEQMGFNFRERSEFIQYWLPVLQGEKVNLIHFAVSGFSENENFSNANGRIYESRAGIEVIPPPQSCFRLMMIYRPAPDNETELRPQQLPSFQRKGFTVTEWGGTRAFIYPN